MENENKPTLEQRVADLEAELKEVRQLTGNLYKSLIAAAEQQGGTIQVLVSGMFAIYKIVPQESLAGQWLRYFLLQAQGVQEGQGISDERLSEMQRHSADLLEMLASDPNEAPTMPDGYIPPSAPGNKL